MQKRYKASLALGISLAGAGLTYPYASVGFWSGMLHHGFLAASIGGLADWFAVTALFRKPLGISYRTQILTRNRERIMNAIVEFASADLLSVKNIMKIVETQDTARMLVDYLRLRDGREKVLEVLDHVLLSAARQLDCQGLARQLRQLLDGAVAEISLPELTERLLQVLAREDVRQPLLRAAGPLLLEVLQSAPMQQFLLSHISVMRKKYEGGAAGRAFVLGLIDLSDEKILDLLNTRCSKALQELENPESPLSCMLAAQLETAMQSSAVQQKVEALLQAGMQRFSAERFEGSLADWLSAELHKAEPEWLQTANALAEEKFNQFSSDAGMQQRYDRCVKNFIAARLTHYHVFLDQMIRARLDEFSDEQLTVFVESRIADDLQMIRINGSVVGAVAGMVIYAAVFCIERMWAL